MTKDEIHENWWNGNRDKKSCCEGIGIGHEYQKRIEDLEKENAELKAKYLQATDEGTSWQHLKSLERENEELEKENTILKKALHLYVDWADECDISWDNFPDMKEKWYKVVEEKGLGWIEGLIFMVTEEAKEQLMKEQSNSQEASE